MFRLSFFITIVLQTLIAYTSPIFVAGATGLDPSYANLSILDKSGSLVKSVQLSQDPSLSLSLTFSNKHLFITGFRKPDKKAFATLWITDLLGNIRDTKYLVNSFTKDSDAKSIIAYKDKLYCAGEVETNKANLWIIDTAGNIVSSHKLNDALLGFASGIFIKNEKIYISGTLTDNDIVKACLWITDLNGNLLLEKILSASSSDARSITSIGKNLFLCGVLGQDLFNQATLWIVDLDGTVVSETILSNTPSEALSIRSFGKNLFICGATYNTENLGYATIWKTNLNASAVISKTSSVFSALADISFSGSKLVMTGAIVNSEADPLRAIFTTNTNLDTITPIPFGGLGFGTSLYIPFTSTPLLNAFQEFQPIHFQKGL